MIITLTSLGIGCGRTIFLYSIGGVGSVEHIINLRIIYI